ncbi:hypothetical protein FRB91_008103, partial [Serendipita sp. 411]
KSHETQNHEDYPQLVRRDLTAEGHMSQADVHDQKSAEYRQKADEFDRRLEEMQRGSAKRKYLTDGANYNDFMSRHHLFTAQAHKNFAEAKALAGVNSSKSGECEEDGRLSEKMASQELRKAVLVKQRVKQRKNVQRYKQRQRLGKQRGPAAAPAEAPASLPITESAAS